MIHFCPIVPTSMNHYLLDFKYNMVLAQRYKNDSKYRDFMLQNREAWDFVIVDNGAAEQSQLLLPELVDIAKALRPTVLVAPDTIQNKNETYTKTELFLKLHYQTLHDIGVQVAVVPQGRTPAEWYESYQGLYKLPGADWICISKYAPCRTEILARHWLATCEKPIHLLGLFNPIELCFAHKWPMIKSIDSQIPISYGYQVTDLPMDFGDRGKLPTDPIFFALSTPGDTAYAYIQRNVQFMQNACIGELSWT